MFSILEFSSDHDQKSKLLQGRLLCALSMGQTLFARAEAPAASGLFGFGEAGSVPVWRTEGASRGGRATRELQKEGELMADETIVSLAVGKGHAVLVTRVRDRPLEELGGALAAAHTAQLAAVPSRREPH